MKNLKIAFIGSSPIITFYINRINDFADCVVFEGGRIGGAWSETTIDGMSFPVANNIICPLNEEEEDLIDNIENHLKALGANISKNKDKLKMEINYTPKQFIVGHFYPAIINVLSNRKISLRKQRIGNIKIEESNVALDGEVFDALILPSNFLIENILLNENAVELKYETFVSKHIRVLFSENVDGPLYSENLDNVFDRGGLTLSEANVFIGRVRREMRNIDSNFLVKESDFLKKKVDQIVISEINLYQHQRPQGSELEKLKAFIEGTPVFCVETRQFVDSFSKINATCEGIKRWLCG